MAGCREAAVGIVVLEIWRLSWVILARRRLTILVRCTKANQPKNGGESRAFLRRGDIKLLQN
jgi:hypothetical protein